MLDLTKKELQSACKTLLAYIKRGARGWRKGQPLTTTTVEESEAWRIVWDGIQKDGLPDESMRAYCERKLGGTK